MTDISDLPRAERLKRYRDLAADAAKLADRSKEQFIKESYTLLAQQWQQLANDLEATLKRDQR